MSKRILCAVDLSHKETEVALLKHAAKLAGFYGATLNVVTVVPDYGMSIVGSFFKEGTMKTAIEAANTQLHDFVTEVLPDGPKVRHIVEVGNVYEQILDAIKVTDADLVIVGAHKPDMSDRIIGPNAARISRYAKCSVLVVRD